MTLVLTPLTLGLRNHAVASEGALAQREQFITAASDQPFSEGEALTTDNSLNDNPVNADNSPKANQQPQEEPNDSLENNQQNADDKENLKQEETNEHPEGDQQQKDESVLNPSTKLDAEDEVSQASDLKLASDDSDISSDESETADENPSEIDEFKEALANLKNLKNLRSNTDDILGAMGKIHTFYGTMSETARGVATEEWDEFLALVDDTSDAMARIESNGTIEYKQTLQDAINACNGGETVYLLKDMTGSISIYGGYLSLSKKLTLNIENRTIDGDNKNTVLSIKSGADVTLKATGAVITGGYNYSYSYYDGRVGGIYVNNSTLTMEGGSITGNSGSDAGGIRCLDNASVALTGVTINDNKCNSGYAGGIYAMNSTLTINGGAMKENTGGLAGGIYTSNTALTITDGSTITSNTGSAVGGIYVYGNQTTELNSVVIESNTATNDNAGAGGIYAKNSTLTMSGGRVADNEGSLAGGVYASDNSLVALVSVSVNSNTATNDNAGAGGVYARNSALTMDSAPTMTAGEVIGNVGGIAGGVGIEATGTGKIADGNLSNVTIKNNTGVTGGGLCCWTDMDGAGQSKATITDCIIEANTGTTNGHAGGGIAAHYNTTLSISGGSICGNTDKQSGAGGICAFGNRESEKPSITIKSSLNGNCLIEGNTSENGTGGVSVFNKSTLTMDNGTITNNEGRKAGGISASDYSTITLNNVAVEKNKTSRGMAGGIYISGSTLNIADGTVAENTGGGAGGIYASRSTENSSVKLINVVITNNNTTLGIAGGIYVSDSTLTMGGGKVTQNTGSVVGGVGIEGIDTEKETKATLTSVQIIENKSSQPNGSAGGVYAKNSTLIMEYGSITANAGGTAGGVGIEGIGIGRNAEGNLTKVTITRNTGNTGGGLCCWTDMAGTGQSKATITNCTIEANTGTSNYRAGGGIAAHYNATVALYDSSIAENIDKQSGAGGICAFGDYSTSTQPSITIESACLEGNTSENGAGAICRFGPGTIVGKNCIIKDNKGSTANGLSPESLARTFENTIFSGNSKRPDSSSGGSSSGGSSSGGSSSDNTGSGNTTGESGGSSPGNTGSNNTTGESGGSFIANQNENLAASQEGAKKALMVDADTNTSKKALSAEGLGSSVANLTDLNAHDWVIAVIGSGLIAIALGIIVLLVIQKLKKRGTIQ